LFCTDPKKLDRKNLTFGVQVTIRIVATGFYEEV